MNQISTKEPNDYDSFDRKANQGFYPWHSHPATIARYCLGSSDPLKTAQFYTQTLGFDLIQIHGDGYMTEKFGQVIFIGYTNGKGGREKEAITVYVPYGMVTEYYREIKAKGLPVELHEGCPAKGVTFELQDCNGNLILFKSFASRMELGIAV